MSTRRIVIAITIALAAATMLVPTASAWDGHRTGVVAGIGAGFAPAAHLSRDARDYAATKTGVAGQMLLGYAFSEHFLVAYDVNMAFVRPENVDNYAIPGLRGPSVYWYPGAVGKTLLLTGGFGRLRAHGIEFEYGVDSGWGYELGVGYEPTPHVQIAAFYTGGSGSDNGYTWRDDIFKVLVTAVAY